MNDEEKTAIGEDEDDFKKKEQKVQTARLVLGSKPQDVTSNSVMLIFF